MNRIHIGEKEKMILLKMMQALFKYFIKYSIKYLEFYSNKITIKTIFQFIKSYIKNYPITVLLFTIMTVLHLLTYILGNGATDHETARKFGALMSRNKDVTELPYLLASIYQHIGGMKHYFGNMIALLIFAPYLEKFYGAIKFTILFNVCGIVGNIGQLYLTKNTIASGASGALSGIIGVYIIFFMKKQPIFSWKFKIVMIIYFISWIYDTFVKSGVSVAAHVGGLLCGILFGLLPYSNIRTIYNNYFKSIVKYVVGTVAICGLLFSFRFADDKVKNFFENPFGFYNIDIPFIQEISLYNDVLFFSNKFDEHAVTYYNTLAHVYNGEMTISENELLQMEQQIKEQIEEINSKKLKVETETVQFQLEEIFTELLTLNELMVRYVENRNDVNLKLQLQMKFNEIFLMNREFVEEMKPLFKKVDLYNK